MPAPADTSLRDWFPAASGAVTAVSRAGRPSRTGPGVHTEHFTLTGESGAVTLAHDLPLDRIDNGLAQLVADELSHTGITDTPDAFADVITSLVLSTDPDPAVAWSGFYARTLERLSGPSERPGPAGPDPVQVFASIYRYAAQLIRGQSVLDVAPCLGFWPLLLADRGYQVTGVDTDRRAMALLATMARRRATNVRTVIGDATRLPCRSGGVATATSIHLLEHLEPDDAVPAVEELLRVCVERVIVAVPFETEPTAAFGHLRCFDLEVLRELGAACLGRFGVTRVHVTEHHGGWLVLDK